MMGGLKNAPVNLVSYQRRIKNYITSIYTSGYETYMYCELHPCSRPRDHLHPGPSAERTHVRGVCNMASRKSEVLLVYLYFILVVFLVGWRIIGSMQMLRALACVVFTNSVCMSDWCTQWRIQDFSEGGA